MINERRRRYLCHTVLHGAKEKYQTEPAAVTAVLKYLDERKVKELLREFINSCENDEDWKLTKAGEGTMATLRYAVDNPAEKLGSERGVAELMALLELVNISRNTFKDQFDPKK